MTLWGDRDEKDKGYAWVVCFACFLIFVICDGVGMSFGVLVPEVQVGSLMHFFLPQISKLTMNTDYFGLAKCNNVKKHIEAEI